jgi:Ca2+-binding EF-hand superfamily protein
LLTIIEISEFTRRLTDKYMFNQVKYENLQKELIEFKMEILKKGLIESNLNNLEVYLRELFDPYDKDKFGKIHINDMLLAFMKSDKIILTKGQRYVLRSIIDRDEKDMVNYIRSSKQIAELLKRFYVTSDRRK